MGRNLHKGSLSWPQRTSSAPPVRLRGGPAGTSTFEPRPGDTRRRPSARSLLLSEVWSHRSRLCDLNLHPVRRQTTIMNTAASPRLALCPQLRPTTIHRQFSLTRLNNDLSQIAKPTSP